MIFNIETILRAYIGCALWVSTNDDTPLEDTHSVDDIAPETLAKMRNDVCDFVGGNAQTLLTAKTGFGLTDASIGHDFWLTRNGHGVGFWDRDMGDLGDLLTESCQTFGEVDLYVGDDGKLYV